MDIQEIMKLIQGVSDYGLTSFELEEGNMKISLKREKEMVQIQTPVLTARTPAGSAPAETGMTAGMLGSGTPLILPDASAVAAGMTRTPGQSHAEDENSGTAKETDPSRVVTSPLVGIFYASSSPEEEPFVRAGDRVKKGQVLGIIEAMKLMNEIESEYDGVVEAVLIGNEEMVEYGQPLFRIGQDAGV